MAVRLEGAADLIKRLQALGETRPLMRWVQLEATREAKDRVPVKTGNLRRSIVPGSHSGSHAIVEARATYAAPVELGARPHRIPKNGRSRRPMPIGGSRRLSGKVRAGSSPVAFAWSVNHPGNKPQPYLLPGAKAAVQSARGVLQYMVGKWNGAA